MVNNMLLGIDPGLQGALVVYDSAPNSVFAAHSVPTLRITRNGKEKHTVDLCRLVALTQDLARTYPQVRAVLELVNAMPKQGATSMFAFGRTDGAIETAVVAAGIPYTKVTPQKWKKALECPADKDGALLRANQLMPASAPLWAPERGTRTKAQCVGIAEAALIAYYGSKFCLDR